MSKIAKPLQQKDNLFLPGNRFLEYVNLYIDTFYPHRQRQNIQKNNFVTPAVAYTDNIIFIPFAPPNLQKLKNRINNDLKKLQTIKYPPTHLYYFIDGKFILSEIEQEELSCSLSIPCYRVSFYDDKKLIEAIIGSYKPPPDIEKEKLRSAYDTLYKTPEIEYNILDEIFSFINSTKKESVKITPIKEKLLHLSPKIYENFINTKYTEVKNIYEAYWSNKECVEFFIKQNFTRYECQFYSMLDIIRNHFKKAPFNNKNVVDYPVNDPSYFDELARLLIPPKKQCDPRYMTACKSIVLFFFEYCDFGKKINTDPSLFTKYNNENDTAE